MFRQLLRFIRASCVLLVAFGLGCDSAVDTGKQDAGHGHSHDHDHDHSDQPESFRAAVVELKSVRDQIGTAMENNDPDSAHDPLHNVAHLLKSMPDLAADTDLPESEWDEVKKEVDRLFDAFSDIDSTFHKENGDKQAAYEAAKPTIEEGIAALEAKLPLLGDSPAKANDEHSHHEHGDDDHDHHEEVE